MKSLFTMLLFAGLVSFKTIPPHWQNNFETAKQTAASERKYILLNFSGSDWCIPCIKTHKQIFETAAFTEFADKELVLVNADFPRLKKNQLSKELQKQNDGLADRYNSKGDFPLTLLLTADGKVVKTWEGVPAETPDEFVNMVKQAIHGGISY